MKTVFITISRTEQAAKDLLQGLMAVIDGAPTDVSFKRASGEAWDLYSGYDRLAEDSGSDLDDMLVFLHDDVRFGAYGGLREEEVVMKLLAETKLGGIIGCCGAVDLNANGVWWDRSWKETMAACRGQVFDSYTNTTICWPPPAMGGPTFGPVLVADGLLLAMRRRSWLSVGGFTDYAKTPLTGWHHYDLDICLRMHRLGRPRPVEVMKLGAKHPGSGNYGMEWQRSRAKFVERWKSVLPMRIDV